MSGHRREANRQAIMEQIKSNFLTLYAEGGLDHISIGALCERCGIALPFITIMMINTRYWNP